MIGHAGFVLRRVAASLRIGFWMHGLAAVVLALSLFVFAAFLLVQSNLEKLVGVWGDQVVIHAYLDKRLTGAEAAKLLGQLKNDSQVQRVRHITPELAWRDFQSRLGAQSGLLDGLPRDLLPASMEITLGPNARDTLAVEAFVGQLRNQTGITAVDYPQQWVERLGLMALTVGWTKWLVGGVLFLVTFFVVTSMVKLAVALRRQEIEILQLVGATQATIQAPYVLAGLIQGMAGACLALGMLAMTYYILREHIVAVLGLLVPVSAIYFLDGESAALIVAAGALLGAAGALFGLRRFVRTWKPLKLSR